MSDYDNMRKQLIKALECRQKMVSVSSDELDQLLIERDSLRDIVSKLSTPKSKKKAAPAADADALPAWLPLDAWNAFLDMRKEQKKPATDYAKKLLIKKLAAFYANDLDPGVILNQSIVNGWQDIYAPKEQSTAHRSQFGRDDLIAAAVRNRRTMSDEFQGVTIDV